MRKRKRGLSGAERGITMGASGKTIKLRVLLWYFYLSLFLGVSAWISAGLVAGLSLLGASVLAWWAGSGLKGSLLVGDPGQKVAGFLMAAIFLVIAHFLSFSLSINLSFIDAEIGGGFWYLAGALVGYFTTDRRHAEGSAPSENATRNTEQ